jgi:hypothetical protein
MRLKRKERKTKLCFALGGIEPPPHYSCGTESNGGDPDSADTHSYYYLPSGT